MSFENRFLADGLKFITGCWRGAVNDRLVTLQSLSQLVLSATSLISMLFLN